MVGLHRRGSRAALLLVAVMVCGCVAAPRTAVAAEAVGGCVETRLCDAVSRGRAQDVEPLWAGVTKDTFSLKIGGTYQQSKARELLALVNAARANVGVPALEYDENLEQIAMLRAAETAISFSHTRLNGSGCFSAADEMGIDSVFFCGENILAGNVYSPEFANQLWTNSPGHYQNMIEAGFTSVGFGTFERGGVLYWVECFGQGGGTGFASAAQDGYATVKTEALPQYLNHAFSDIDPNGWYLSPSASDFLYCYNSGIMTGMPNGTFGTNASVTRGQVATILWRLAGEPQASAPAFSDVDYGQYYGKAIDWARSTGVVSGYAATNTFAPERAVSREELVTMMRNYVTRIEGTPLPDASSKAESMPDWGRVEEYARPAFAWAIDEGIVSGVKVDGVSYLKPKDGAARVSTAIMMARFHRDVLR